MDQQNQKKSHLFLDEEANEILGRNPSWLVRRGNTMMLCIAASLIILSMVIYYPDVITGKAEIMPEGIETITTPNYPSEMRVIGAKEGQSVTRGELLYIMHSVGGEGRTDTIRASAEGKIRMQRILKEEGKLPAKATLAVIIPEEGEYRVRIEAPAWNAGKIQLRQKIKISTENYPRDEFGELEAEVIAKPQPEGKGKVSIEARLLNKGITTYGKKLDIAATTGGIATISVSRKTVFALLFR